LGYEEGRNLQLDWRNLADEDAANATAKEFVRNRVDLNRRLRDPDGASR